MDPNTILKFNVNELKEKLGELSLSTTGRKTELQDRLLAYLRLRGEDTTDTEEDPTTQRLDSIQNNRPTFSLNDIKESIPTFDGTGRLKIEYWIQEFEDNAMVVGWDDVRKFVYGKQLIKGTAQTFIRSQRGINNWIKLKLSLLEEFGQKISIAECHRQLEKSKKRPNETNLDFLYKIMEKAKPLNLEEESIIEYFVRGLPDSPNNKGSLYEASSINDLKIKIKAYEKRISERKNYTKINPHNYPKICTACPHLYNHNTEDCRKLNNLCFKCNQKGHKASECKQKTDSHGEAYKHNNKTNKQNINRQLNNTNSSTYHNNNTPNSNTTFHTNFTHTPIKVYKTIKIHNQIVNALLDTGSEVTLIPKSVFDKMNNVSFFPQKIIVNGIGGGSLETIGYAIAVAKIDNIQFNLRFYIVNDSDVSYTPLLGSNILEVFEMNVTRDGASFSQKYKQKSTESMLFDEYLGPQSTEKENNFIARSEFYDICTSTLIEPETVIQNTGMSNEVKTKLLTLINSYKPNMKKTTQVEMKIILTNDEPIYERPRRLAYEEQKIVEKQVAEWLKDDIIRHSHSEFAAPIVLVGKKDGSKRLCCDYRKINLRIVKDNFPMTLIDDVISKLTHAKIFSAIDLKHSFFHVPVDEKSRKYTAFVTHHGQFEFNRAPFGMKNSPAAFCRFIVNIYQELIQKNKIIIYMDDIVIPSKSETENLDTLSQFLEIASNYGLLINWKKCQFVKTEIEFLGYIIKDGSLKPSPGKVKAVINYKVPTDIKSLQRYLGLASYFRRFIMDFATKAKPLTDLLAKGSKFKFEENQKIAFEELKQALVKAPVLKIFDPEKETEVHTDASIYGFGAVLLQKDSEDQKFHPVEFMSRKTTPIEQKNHSYELEVLAIVSALKKWRVYLLGIPFKIITDCNAFTQTVSKKDVPAKIARWIIYLQDFDYKIEHRSATKLKHVDALSRMHSLMTRSSLKHSIIQAQKQDEYTVIVRDLVNKGNYKDFYIKNDILFKDPAKELIVIPQQMEREIIELTHKQGHYATKKTTDLIEKNYYIKDLTKKTEDYIKNCIQCILADAKSGKKEGLLNPIDKSDKPLQTLHMDHLGPMQTTKKQYNYILTIIDAFSKFTWIFPTKSTSAEETINKLEKVTAIFGNPQRIITDRGTSFTAHIFQNFCESNAIQHILITTGLPRANGQVERMHKVITSMLTKLCLENSQNWYKYTDRVQQYINNTPSRSTKFSPFKILTGLDMNTPQDEQLKQIIDEEIITEMYKNRDEIRLQARDNIQKIQEENRKSYNKNRQKEMNYDIGGTVAIKRTQFGPGLKLKPKFLGPYRVTAKKTMARYEVEKIGQTEGAFKTTSTAEFRKKCSRIRGRISRRMAECRAVYTQYKDIHTDRRTYKQTTTTTTSYPTGTHDRVNEHASVKQ